MKNVTSGTSNLKNLVKKLITDLAKQQIVKDTVLIDKLFFKQTCKSKIDIPKSKKRIIDSFFVNLYGIKERADSELFKLDKNINRSAINILYLHDTTECEYDDNLLCWIAKCNSLLCVYLCSGFVETEIKSVDDFYANLSSIIYDTYYRGQSDYNFDLIPSFYRKLKIDGDTLEITKKFIMQKYTDIGVLEKYREVFDESKTTSLDILTFVQHTISYSPLLDVTESKEIAAVFATSSHGINPNRYFNTDSSIYCFYVTEKNGDLKTSSLDAFQCMRMLYIQKQISFYEKIRDLYLYEMNYKDFKIKYYFTSNQRNDRMKIQKGHFFFVYDGCIINGHMLIPFYQITVVKYKIRKEIKSALYTDIVQKNRKYELKSLMDPYSYFSDYSYSFNKGDR